MSDIVDNTNPTPEPSVIVANIDELENSPQPATPKVVEVAIDTKKTDNQITENKDSVVITSDSDDDDSTSDTILALQTKTKKEIPDKKEETEEENIMLSPISPFFKTSTNSYIKKLQNLKDISIENINISDIESSDQNFRIAYEDSRKNMLMAPRLTKVPLILSGYHAEISAFSHSDILSLVRNLDSPDFVRRTTMIANAIYDHVISTSKGDLTFENWIASTKYIDMQSIFFGIYSGTYPGENPYQITCPNPECGDQFILSVNNNDLAYISSPLVRDKDLAVIMSGDDSAIKDLEIYKQSNPKKPISKLIPESKIYVEYTIPSIKDFIDTIVAIQSSGKYTNVANIENYESLEFRFLYIYPYISKLGLPVIVKNSDGVNEVSWKTTYDRKLITGIINSLTQKDFEALYEDKNVFDLINERGIQFSIKAMDCPKCHKRIESVPLDIKTIFFTLAQETLDPSQ